MEIKINTKRKEIQILNTVGIEELLEWCKNSLDGWKEYKIVSSVEYINAPYSAPIITQPYYPQPTWWESSPTITCGVAAPNNANSN